MSQHHPRLVSPAQLLGLLLSFISVSALMGILGAGLLVPLTGSATIVTKTAPSILNDLPSEIKVVEPAEEFQLLDANGGVIARFCNKQRIVVPSANIADIMKQVIIAIKNKRFYERNGVDATGIARALINDLGESGTQGASTIIQQYIRNALAEKGYLEGDADQVSTATEQTAARKFREIKHALAIERTMDRDQILTGYLNIAPFGPITYSAEAASQRYFSKSASELSYLEVATLAGLIQSPVEHNLLSYPEAPQERRNLVLSVMLEQGIITNEKYDAEIEAPLADTLNPTNTAGGCIGANGSTGYFRNYVITRFLQDEAFGQAATEHEHLLKTGGLTIRTTLDPAKQQATYAALISTIPADDPSDADDALISLIPSTGAVVAMAQNTTYGVEMGQTMNSCAADGQFQIGSAFRIFTLAEWFKGGHSAYEAVDSTNRNYGSGAFRCGGTPISTEPWRVEDLTGRDGPMDVVKAAGLSVDQAFVNIASRPDFCQIFQTAADMSITENGETIAALPTNTISSSSASPLQVTSTFAIFDNGGLLCEPMPISTVTDRDENTVEESVPNCSRVLDSNVANQVATLLTASASQYYIFTRLADGRPFATESGITDYSANTWFTDFTPSLVTSAWVGHADSSTTPVRDIVINGTYYHAIFNEIFVGQQIWAPYMSTALADTGIEPMHNASLGNSVVSMPRQSR